MFGKADRYVCLAWCWTIKRVSSWNLKVELFDRTLGCTHYSGYFTAALRTALLELGQVPTCQHMSSEMKLQVPLIQGSRLAIVITEHVKKCTQEISMQLWQQSINAYTASGRQRGAKKNWFFKKERIINKTEKCMKEGTTGDRKLSK